MIVPLANHRAEIERLIRSASRIWLGLDFDGTLVAITNHPDRVYLHRESRSVLQTLADHPRMSVAVISGRELHDVREKVNLDCISYSGNHGLEILGGNLRYENQTAAALQEAVNSIAKRSTIGSTRLLTYSLKTSDSL